ncbi:MAG TPA: heparinase II/III family protein, partial [Sporichthya sp.]|nr:heparinase II/III family protein [Sporichthya sp.]
MRRGVVPGLGFVLCASLAVGGAGVRPEAAQAAARSESAAARVKAQCPQTATADDRAKARRIMAGWLDVPGFGAARIGTSGDIDWHADPFHHPSWVARFQGLAWVQPLLIGATRDSARAKRAAAILRDFLADNPVPAVPDLAAWEPTVTAKRALTLVCATTALGRPPWLMSGLTAHGKLLSEQWSGAWNRGAFEIRGLLALGCFTGNAGWMELARSRVAASFEDNLRGPAIDTDGASNEQALGYSRTVYYVWQEVARELVRCGLSVPDVLTERLPLLLGFLAGATMPDGHLVPLGDTYGSLPPPLVRGTPAEYAATLGAQGEPPADVVGVYAGGYVFGRSGWGTERPFGAESFYSLRFGPGRQLHGHNDHQAITWYAGGRPLLVDSGHVGYAPDAYRDYLRSARAHNVLVAPDSPLDGSAVTALERQDIETNAQYFEVADDAIGARRIRNVLFLQHPDMIVVLDRVIGGPFRRYDQLWHLPPDLQATSVTPNEARATDPAGNGLTVLSVPMLGQLSSPSIGYVRGAEQPYQGWVSGELGQREPAGVITVSQVAQNPTFLTVLVASDPGTAVRADFLGVSPLGGVLTL